MLFNLKPHVKYLQVRPVLTRCLSIFSASAGSIIMARILISEPHREHLSRLVP